MYPGPHPLRWLFDAFPDVATLEAAPIEDVAFVVLEQLRRHVQNGRVSVGNLVRGFDHDIGRAGLGFAVAADFMIKGGRIIREAVAWLLAERLIADECTTDGQFIITRMGENVRTKNDMASYAKRAYLPADVLREGVSEVALAPFLAGRYDESVRAAFTRLEVSIRTAAGYGHDRYGVQMVREAFNPGKKDDVSNIGPLADPELEFTEREAVAHLFAGAIGFIKNPLSHRELKIDDARLAASRILLANDLMNTLAAHLEKKLSRERTTSYP